MNRRTFLKALIGAVSGIAAAAAGVGRVFGAGRPKQLKRLVPQEYVPWLPEQITIGKETWDFNETEWTLEFWYRLADGEVHHIAEVRQNNQTWFYVDGRPAERPGEAERLLIEWIDDLRISDIARYTKSFRLDSFALSESGGFQLVGDDNTKLLMSC